MARKDWTFYQNPVNDAAVLIAVEVWKLLDRLGPDGDMQGRIKDFEELDDAGRGFAVLTASVLVQAKLGRWPDVGDTLNARVRGSNRRIRWNRRIRAKAEPPPSVRSRAARPLLAKPGPLSQTQTNCRCSDGVPLLVREVRFAGPIPNTENRRWQVAFAPECDNLLRTPSGRRPEHRGFGREK
jgi:hypothetical protein